MLDFEIRVWDYTCGNVMSSRIHEIQVRSHNLTLWLLGNYGILSHGDCDEVWSIPSCMAHSHR